MTTTTSRSTAAGPPSEARGRRRGAIAHRVGRLVLAADGHGCGDHGQQDLSLLTRELRVQRQLKGQISPVRHAVPPALHVVMGAIVPPADQPGDARLAQDGERETIAIRLGKAGRIHIKPFAEPQPRHALGNRRAHGIHRADEENRMQFGRRCRVHRSCPFHERAAMSVKRRRAVLWSISILPSSRSMTRPAPSSCTPLRPISIASIRSGEAERIAS